jgi:hypothetical protein
VVKYCGHKDLHFSLSIGHNQSVSAVLLGNVELQRLVVLTTDPVMEELRRVMKSTRIFGLRGEAGLAKVVGLVVELMQVDR